MHLLQLLNCVRGKHQRSRGHARHDGDIFRSRCRGCGKPMVRTVRGWVIDMDPEGEGLTEA